MMKRGILLIIMMISTLGIFSFKNDTNDAKKTSFASFYHDKFNGRKTASGDIFSNSKLTAANRTLPFGTKVKVTNLRSGKSVIVEINDRGPFHSSRALDLTKAAFKAIGNPSRGTMPVEYEIIDYDL
ncbi:septal ring lytic transglycosylase RlpA family protein [Kaistella polysaccharea]|uniref:septal ring lytic transglycosylase RlpA family protein n=1 Tax=Kaistella polysaccharea TaxID=2878534 RepID=UPI001CF530C7|nr:septal ring lytic transglycosylase RlpA family protein [Kaistella polysaccharea]